MLSEDTLRGWLASAVYAPSGDNSQPWEFEIRDSTLVVYNKPHADGTLYNFNQLGSFVAHGALIENIAMLARRTGFEAQVEVFPSEENCTAYITFTEQKPQDEPLCDELTNRSTNRKPYDTVPLKPAHTEALVQAADERGEAVLSFVEDRSAITALGKVVSLNERLIIGNRGVHDFLFGMIRWSKNEEAQKPGLFVDTMELPPPVRFLFKYVLGYWPLARLLHAVGFSRLVAMQTAQLYAACSAVCVITVPAQESKLFLAAGRALQKFWLTATSLGVSVQPMAAIPYLAARVRAGEAQAFSAAEQALIVHADERIRDLSCCGTDPIAMICRVGYAPPPTAGSAKLPPVIRSSTTLHANH